MGCGASNDPKVAVADSQRRNNTYNNNNNNNNINKSSRSNNNGFQKVELKNSRDSYNQYNRPNSDKKPLAFVIEFDEKKKSGNISNRPPPGRLQLEPIKKPSNLTQAELDAKMRQAEKNRENIMRNKVKSSRNKSGHSNNQSRTNSGSVNGSSYYNNDSRKMSRDDRDFNFNSNYDQNNGYSGHNGYNGSFQQNGHNGSFQQNGYNGSFQQNGKRTEERERLLQKRRIVHNPVSDDEIEHNRRDYNDDDYF